MISLISSIEIINIVVSYPNLFLCIAASVPACVAVNPNGVKTLLGNGLSTCPFKGNPVFRKGPKSLPKNPPDYPILWKWVFDKFILANEPLTKALWNFETCVLVNKNLCRKLFSSLESPTSFDEVIFYSRF